jgi:hypothetical protein
MHGCLAHNEVPCISNRSVGNAKFQSLIGQQWLRLVWINAARVPGAWLNCLGLNDSEENRQRKFVCNESTVLRQETDTHAQLGARSMLGTC